MPESPEPESHADSHDRDKLDRWRQGLEQDHASSFPVCAIFLVSEKDQYAHDSFRRFRDSFERRNAGFHHLVIFGQHGVSTTVRALLAKLSLAPDQLPCLMMTAGGEGKEAAVFPLPPGEEPTASAAGEIPSPETVLRQVETVIDNGEGMRKLGDIPGGTSRGLDGRTLAQVAATLLTQV